MNRKRIAPARETKSGPAAPRSRRRRLELAAALVLVGAAVTTVHSPVLSAQALSLDDNEFVRDNTLVTHPSVASSLRFFLEVTRPSTVTGYYIPLTMTSLMLDYAMGGRPGNLRVFHITNLALHVLNTSLILLLLLRLFGALVPAALAALLFGLHPLTVEPTAWVAERKTILAAFFALASILCYVRWCRSRRGAWTAASLAFYVLALLSKPTVTMLPLLLVLLDGWPLRRFSRVAIIEKWPYVLIAIAFGIVTLVSQNRAVGIAGPERSHLVDWPFQASYRLAFYLGKIVWPTRLSCVYPEPFPLSLSNLVVIGAALTVLALTILLALLWRRSRGPLTGWLFFCIAIAPTLGLIQYSWVTASDKYVYLPAFGIVMVVGAGLAGISKRTRGPAGTALVLAPVWIVLGLETAGTRLQLRNWKDSLTLFLHIEPIAPDSPVVQNELGIQYGLKGEPEEAIRHFRAALRLMPDLAETHFNLGIALRSVGKIDESIEHLRRAAELRSTHAPAALQLGESLFRAGRLAEAEAEFHRALALMPDFPEALAELGLLLLREGRSQEAIDAFRAGLVSAPQDVRMQLGLARALQLRDGGAADSTAGTRSGRSP